MPGGDGTGPAGMGPMTGRAAGYCVGYDMPGSVNPVVGRGFGAGGRGGGGGRGGRGRRNQFYATRLTGRQRASMGATAFGGAMPSGAPYAPTMSSEQQLDALKGQAEYFADTLNGIRKRIEELEAKGKND